MRAELSGLVSVADITFALNGEGFASPVMITDADRDSTFELVGSPSVFQVMSSPEFGTGMVYAAISGAGGLQKNGPGVLYLAATNTYAGETLVSQGILRMGERSPNSLGATGAGNGTVVLPGAALDINGATPNGVNSAEPLFLSGSGPDGQGALVNRGAGCMNSGFTGGVTLQGDTTVGCLNRIDVRSAWSGNGYTLTKGGNSELAVGNAVNNCRVVINAGYCTYMHDSALGGSDFNTTLNGGALRTYGNWTVNEHLVCNGGAFIGAGSGTNLFKLAGRMTLNGLTGVWGENNNMSIELAGLMEGPGGLSRSGGGSVYVTGNSNTYSGATLISSTLYLGRTNVAAGVFGSGPITNTSNLFIDRSGSFVSSNGFFGSGSTSIRYGGEMVMSASFSSNSTFRVGAGTLTLTNGAQLVAYGRFYFADRTLGYPVDPTNITATLNVHENASLATYSFEAGNGGSVAGGGMTGTVNQTGGLLRTTGWSGDPVNFPGEYDGLRIAHYPQAYGVYNLSGGTVSVENGYRLAVATDGTGWLRRTGGNRCERSRGERAQRGRRLRTADGVGRCAQCGQQRHHGRYGSALPGRVRRRGRRGAGADELHLEIERDVVRHRRGRNHVRHGRVGGRAFRQPDRRGRAKQVWRRHADALRNQQLCGADACSAGPPDSHGALGAACRRRGPVRGCVRQCRRAALCAGRPLAGRPGRRRGEPRGPGQGQTLHRCHLGRRAHTCFRWLGPAGAVVCPL